MRSCPGAGRRRPRLPPFVGVVEKLWQELVNVCMGSAKFLRARFQFHTHTRRTKSDNSNLCVTFRHLPSQWYTNIVIDEIAVDCYYSSPQLPSPSHSQQLTHPHRYHFSPISRHILQHRNILVITCTTNIEHIATSSGDHCHYHCYICSKHAQLRNAIENNKQLT